MIARIEFKAGFAPGSDLIAGRRGIGVQFVRLIRP
jgi:hypothetical protein